ncbi:MAG TPA: acetyl-CoA C-acyltransferase, partial [Gemmatimonadaceae bacterium]|nr:acetyl-CoA C-acyltransferase [Gemmatimonadaceae bacterium]
MSGYGTTGNRVALIAGVRTPFARAGTVFKHISAIELGKRCVAELIQRTNLDGDLVEALVYGTVVPAVTAPNIAREVSLMPMLSRGCDAYTVSRACASANQAVTDAADQIVLGHRHVVIAGGAESLSNVPILHSRSMSEKLVALSRAKTFGQRAGIIASIRPNDLVPITPAIAEPSTGETMGQSAEKMAKINHVSREDQDQFALRSHRLANVGTEDGRLGAEMFPLYVPPRYDTVLARDNGIRADTSIEQLRALKPVFDKRYGTVTAGNASPLTDGASAVLLMSEERARILGYKPLAFIRSYAYSALDPGEQLLMGPVLAAPVALQRAGISLKDINLIEMHEAFAAQVLCNLMGFASREWAKRAGFTEPVGEIDRSILNVMGGSVAIGHPFGATGGRILTTL